MGFIKNFIKKYAALLPPIGLLIFAVILFLPALWLGSKVKAQMDSSAGQAQTIRSLMADVPPRDKPAQIKAYMDRLENDVTQIDELIWQSSQRELIAWNIFPEPKDTSSQIYVEFGEHYQKAIENLLSEMKALDAPSENEIQQRTGTSRTATPGAGMYAMGGAAGRRTTAQDPMVDALCIARAESISVYANPSAFAWYGFWQNFQYEGKDAAVKDCWNSQIALWIYEDVVKSIQAMNVGSGRVSTSPVKRLLGISFTGPVQISDARQMGGMYRTGQPGQQTSERDNPNFVTSTHQSVFVHTPWTGRVGGADYDVVHFATSVIIDNHHVMGFMQELCSQKEHTFREGFQADGNVVHSRHNQITILQSAVHVVDKDNPIHELYRYGNGAAVRLDIVGEYLLNRKGYDEIKPDSIKIMLEQKEVQADTQGMGMGMGMGVY